MRVADYFNSERMGQLLRMQPAETWNVAKIGEARTNCQDARQARNFYAMSVVALVALIAVTWKKSAGVWQKKPKVWGLGTVVTLSVISLPLAYIATRLHYRQRWMEQALTDDIINEAALNEVRDALTEPAANFPRRLQEANRQLGRNCFRLVPSTELGAEPTPCLADLQLNQERATEMIIAATTCEKVLQFACRWDEVSLLGKPHLELGLRYLGAVGVTSATVKRQIEALSGDGVTFRFENDPQRVVIRINTAFPSQLDRLLGDAAEHMPICLEVGARRDRQLPVGVTEVLQS